MITKVAFAVHTACHPQYRSDAKYWTRWRDVYEGGQNFIDKYLQRFSTRESQEDFTLRKKVTYSPAFAKAAVVDIRNSIYQRMCEVRRLGPVNYLDTCHGKNGGVDTRGRGMSNYLGTVVLDELLTMARVAVWVDNIAEGETKATKSQPYLTTFKVEDIRAWDDLQNPTSILLRETELSGENHGLITTETTLFRLAKEVVYSDLSDEYLEAYKIPSFQGTKVYVEIYDDQGTVKSRTLLDLPKIPVVIMTLSQSLLKDVAEYQIALLNLASSDMAYALKSNFPFYTEQYSPSEEFMKKVATTDDEGNPVDTEGDGIGVGVSKGRRYAKGMERPQFIAPPTEPLKVSMEKQEQLKREIRLLVNLSLSNISPTRSSRESKDSDNQALEAGLSYIAQELERAENLIAGFWSEYLNSGETFSVTYPDHYSLKSDEQLLKEANDDLELAAKVNAPTAKKALVKRAVSKALRSSLTAKELQAVANEIDSSQVVITDPTQLREDVALGLVSTETASLALTYPTGEAGKAKEELVERMAATAIAQSKATAHVGEVVDTGNGEDKGTADD